MCFNIKPHLTPRIYKFYGHVFAKMSTKKAYGINGAILQEN